MSEKHYVCSSVTTNYSHKDITTLIANETHINSDQMEFDSGERNIAENGTAQNANTGNFLISAIMNADPELEEDVKKRTEADEEKRIEKLRENGMRGGRPRIERSDLARMCADAVFTKHGQYLLRRHKKNWYHYQDGAYAPMRDDDVRMKVSGWINRSKVADVSRTLIGDILESIGDDSMCGLTSDKYTMPSFISTGESAAGFVSMQNGIISIDEIVNAMEKGLTPPAIRPHTPDFFTTVKVPYAYDPSATCPKFETYLEGVQPKAENREILQMLAGLLLTSDMSYNVAFFLFGESGTGKSIFMDVLEDLVGEEDCCCVPLASFAEKFGTADLTEKKANLVDEAPIIPESGRFSDIESVFKAATSGRPIQVQRKGVEPWTARVTAHCVFASNNLPTLTDRSNGVWDRMRIIPFNVKFRGTDQQDQHLINKLKEELPGILNWALRGLVKLHSLTSLDQKKKTFPQCAEGGTLLAKMQEDSNHEQKFLREETKAATSDKYLGALNLYGNYKSWAERRGYRAVGYDKFRDAVLRVYPDITSGRKTVNGQKDTVFYGIDWYTDFPEFTMTAIPTTPPVQGKQVDESDNWDVQPNLGF